MWIARRATKARGKNKIENVAYLEAAKKKLEHEIQSRVSNLKSERGLRVGDTVFRHINMKGGEAGVDLAIRTGDVYVQSKETFQLCRRVRLRVRLVYLCRRV
jgi:hypothetical protein